MKIGIFTIFFPKISETFTLNRITRLIDAGIDVKLYAIKNPAVVKPLEDTKLETETHPDVDKYNLMNLVIYFPRLSNGDLDYRGIEDQIQKDNLDLIHFQWGTLGEEILQKCEINIPTLVSFHSHRTPSNWNIKYSHFTTCFSKANVLLPVSEYIKNGLISMGYDPQKIIVHHMGVDLKLFSPSSSKPENNRINFLSVGSFIEKKGFHDALSAIGMAKRDGLTNFEYTLVGDGPLKEKYLQIINEYDLAPNIKFAGKLTQDLIVEEYKKADIYIHPSVIAANGDDEGIPTVIMEAMAMKLPVISTFHTGIPEIVRDKICGYLSEEHDIESIAQDICTLSKELDLRTNMGNEGRKIVESGFNVDKLNKEMINLYSNIL